MIVKVEDKQAIIAINSVSFILYINIKNKYLTLLNII